MERPNGRTMNAWTIDIGQREPRLTKIPIPTVEQDELLIKVLAMGVCHSDCAILSLDQGFENWQPTFVLGHEGAGEVVQLGSGVDPGKFKVGDRVSIHIIPGCDDDGCLQCSRRLQRICRAKGSGNYGLGRDGMFAEYVAVHSKAAVKVPEGVTMEQAAIASDAVLTAYHAIKYTANVQPDDTILIFGLGGLGLNALQTAQHLGVKRILVCDRRREAVDLAVKLGVHPEDAFCSGDADSKPIEAVIAEKGIVVDTVIDLAGHEQTIASAQLCVRPAGTIVMVGLLSAQAPVIPLIVVINMLTIKGTYNGTIAGLGECLDLLSKGVIRPEIVTGSIKELPSVLKDLDDGKIRGRMVLLPTWEE